MFGYSSTRSAVTKHLSRHIHCGVGSTTRLGSGLRKRAAGSRLVSPPLSTLGIDRLKSTAAAAAAFQESSSDAATGKQTQKLSSNDSEFISFPVKPGDEQKPVLLNAQEHAVGYLSKILNARVYDAAKETELQHAKNLSAVSFHNFYNNCAACRLLIKVFFKKGI